MKTNDTWQQKLLLKDKTGRVLDSYEWTCVEGDESNTDGFVDAFSRFKKSYPSLETVYDNEYDDVFDTVVIEQESWTDGNFTIEASPSDRL